jgi:hypothetical protein
MNFKDQYRKEMSGFTPSPESTQRLQAALQTARKPKGSSLRRLRWGLSAAAAACAVMIAVVALWQPGGPGASSTVKQVADAQVATDTTPQLQTAGANYQNVRALFRRIDQEQKVQEEQVLREERVEALKSLLNPFAWGGLNRKVYSESSLGSSTPNYESTPQTSDSSMSQETAAGQTPSTVAPDYSNTNIQVEGVQEADIIKTDGHYIYALGPVGLRIISPNNGHPRLLGSAISAGNANAFFNL